MREAAGRPLPRYVQDEFEAYLKCGRLEHGFLRVRCEDCRRRDRSRGACNQLRSTRGAELFLGPDAIYATLQGAAGTDAGERAQLSREFEAVHLW